MSTVLVLTVDSLRLDQFRKRLFPETWSTFERDFVQFETAYSHGVATPFSMPGLLAGTIPAGDGAVPADQSTLAERLDTDFAYGFLNNVYLTADRGFGSGFDVFSSRIPLDRSGARLASAEDRPAQRGDVVTAALRDCIDTHEDQFLWGHYMDAHFPFQPETAVGFDDDLDEERFDHLMDRYRRNERVPDVETVRRLHAGNVRYIDRQFARLFRQLRRSEQYHDSLIVVTADHGELFGTDGQYGHPWHGVPRDELIRVPLLVKLPEYRSGGTCVGDLVDHRRLHKALPAIHRRPGEITMDELRTEQTTSVSNTAVRVTTPTGTASRTRTNEVDVEGDVDSAILDRLEERAIPDVPVLDPETGTRSASIEEQLRHLGYLE
ncbi:MAG: sulfatase-like hydrolase/transferase [Halorhabdus sp.]